MAVIIRRPKPITVIRRSRPPEPSGGRDWPLRPGYPYNAHEAAHHAIEIRGELHILLWRPSDEMWTCGLAQFSPSVIGQHNYAGQGTVVYRAPPVEVPKFLRRRNMK